MIEPGALQMVLMVLTGWLDRRERHAVAYLMEENRLLRRQLGGRRLIMAFVGLIPSEYSSGAKRVHGPITKTGHAHLRRVLVESAWHYRHHPFLGDALARRQRGAPQAAIDHAWVAQRRLHRRYRRLAARGKSKQLIVTAVAQELTGFLWAVLTQ